MEKVGLSCPGKSKYHLPEASLRTWIKWVPGTEGKEGAPLGGHSLPLVLEERTLTLKRHWHRKGAKVAQPRDLEGGNYSPMPQGKSV